MRLASAARDEGGSDLNGQRADFGTSGQAKRAGPLVGLPRVIIYFLRSLRFQQAVSEAAFSLVIGIRVVYIDPFPEPGLTPEETSHLIMPAICSACVGTS